MTIDAYRHRAVQAQYCKQSLVTSELEAGLDRRGSDESEKTIEDKIVSS